VLHSVILLFIPVIALLRHAGVQVADIGSTPFWLAWLLFAVGWVVVVYATVAVAMKRFIRFMHLTEWNSLLFDRFYGFDIEIWSAFLGYSTALTLFVFRSGLAGVLSDMRAFMLMVLVAAMASVLSTLLAARFIFGSILHSHR